MSKLKKSPMPFAYLYTVKIVMLLPNFMRHLIFGLLAKKMTICFSNVPGPKKPFVVDGSKCKCIAFFPPVLNDLTGSITIISMAEALKMAIFVDDAAIEDSKVLMEFIHRNLDEVLTPEWRQFDTR